MTDEKWNEKKEVIGAWFNANPEMAKEHSRQSLSDGFFGIGDLQPDRRKQYWTSISSLFAGLSNSPLGPGRASNFSVGQKSQLDLHIEAFKAFRMAQYDNDKYSQATSKAHGKSGGQLYRLMDDSAAATAQADAKAERSLLTKAFNASHAGDTDARYLWPTIPHPDGESMVLDFSLFESKEGANDGYPNITYNASMEEEE